MDHRFDDIIPDVGPEVEEFANALDNCLSPFLSIEDKKSRILDLPRKYYENAVRRLQQASPKRARQSSDVDMDVDDVDLVERDGYSAESEEVRLIEKEVQTWDLVRRLLPLRYSSLEASTFETSSSSLNIPRSGLLSEFLQGDAVAQERYAVLQWLQSNAASASDIDDLSRELLEKANRGDIFAHGWLHTKSAIKLRKGVTAWSQLLDRQSPNVMNSHLNTDGAPLITQLDPDAVTRQGRKLEPADEYFERAIWLGCFEHLRRGSSLETLRDWCHERTEVWRSISMSALLLPNDDVTPREDISPSSLALWRRMCFALARQGGSDAYERAVYGLLSGDIPSVEKVASRWDDYLFANYNALLRTQLDSFVLGRCPQDAASKMLQTMPSFDAVQFLGDEEGVERRLVISLEALDSVKDEALEPNKALQAALIAKDIDRHLYEQGLVMTEDANRIKQSKLLPQYGATTPEVTRRKYYDLSQHQGLRIISHVYVLTVLLDKLRFSDKSAVMKAAKAQWIFSQESILAGYTDFLRRSGLQELIPLYCSILDAPRQYEVLSWNLIHEEDPQQRLLQLKLIKKAGIDVLKFVDKQALLFAEGLIPIKTKRAATVGFSIVRDSDTPSRLGKVIKPDFFGEEEGLIDPRHEHVIRSLEWLLMVDGMWPKVLSMGTRAYKFFLQYGYLDAARLLMNRVPFEKVLLAVAGEEETNEAWFEDIEFWSQQLDRSEVKDTSPVQVFTKVHIFRGLEALVKALDSLETVASLMVLSMETLHNDREFWSGAGPVIKKTKENMQPLLQAWLLNGILVGDPDLEEIRLTYLPETILAYVSALHFAGTGLSRDNLLEAMELAAIVAERGSDLADAFKTVKRMTELVDAFAVCSKALAIATGDKRSAGSSSKRMKEMGWSRDLWSVKTGNSDASVPT